MTLVGGWLFLLFYLLFRSIPYITKRIPAKYPALVCAWFGLILYLCISGISVATIRAFLMATLIFAATLFGRSVFSLRNAALVFLVIFIINPFFVMNAGFQLSFAAVFGLLWFYEGKEYIKRDVLHRIFHTLYMIFVTTFIASIFTLPFIIAHFGYIPVYTLLGNIVILPIFSFAIMPLIMIGTICALFGNYSVIDITNIIYDWALMIAKHITDLPYANLKMPYISNTVLLISIFGLMCMVLIAKPDSKNFIKRNINYVLCVCCVFCAIIISCTQTKPLFYSTTDNELVGFVVNGKLKFNKAKSSKHFFAFNSWRKFNNEKLSDKNERYKCDHGFCIYKTEKWTLVYMQTFTTVINHIEETCRDKSVDFIVSPFKIKAPKCHAKILHDGLLIDKNGKITKFANRRPWHNQH
jgi:ComEC/Rec2-related protein